MSKDFIELVKNIAVYARIISDGFGVEEKKAMAELLRTFQNAVDCCAVREAIYRNDNPGARYYKNHPIPLKNRVPIEDQTATDWRIYDPRDDDGGSLFMFND